MVEVIEVKRYHARSEAMGRIEFKSLSDLQKVAETFNVTYIFKEEDEKKYCFFHEGICYYC